MSKSQSELIRVKVKKYIKKNNLFAVGDRVLLAVSGGPDSLAMLHILHLLSEELGLFIAVAHFDHQLRGEESRQEALFVEQTCSVWGIPFYLGTADIHALAKGQNMHQVARDRRYGFFRKILQERAYTCIATAHHLQDQAETVLLHLLRGSGIKGLGAMAPCEGDLIRPLLCLTREEIMAYCELERLDYQTDSSNLLPKYQRNKLRLELLPQLLSYNPQLLNVLGDLADICREDDRVLTALTADYLSKYSVIADDQASFSLNIWQQLPVALKRRVARSLFAGFTGGELDFYHTQLLVELKNGKKTSLPGNNEGYLADKLYLYPQKAPQPRTEHFYEHVVIGEGIRLFNSNWYYDAKISSVRDEDFKGSQDTMVLPVYLLSQLAFRNRQEGDYFYPVGMTGKKSLKKMLIEVKVPAEERNVYPLLLLNNGIIWVPKLRKGFSPPAFDNGLWIKCYKK